MIKLCMSTAADLVLGKTYSKKMTKISFLDSTIKTPIEFQVFEKLQASPFFQFNVMKQLILLNPYWCVIT